MECIYLYMKTILDNFYGNELWVKFDVCKIKC